MKKLLFSFLGMVICFAGFSQLERITIEETTLTTGTVAGLTNYRIFAEAALVTDEVDRVIGSSTCPTNIDALDNPFYVHPGAGNIESGSINPFFFGFGAPEILHTTMLTIGTGALGYLGVPLAEDGDGALAGLTVATDGLVPLAAGSTGITYFDGTDPWSVMAGGGNLLINSVAGGTWFTTGGSNALGYGVNNSVLLASLTTDGDISFNISVGTQETLGNVDYLSCSDNIDNLIYPLPGCMDAASCNYNEFADVTDGSCTGAPVGCDECAGSMTDGTGTLTDNPEVGETCDDGDAGTTGDEIQGDCSCAGVAAPSDDCAGAAPMTIDGGAVAGDNTGTGDQNDPDDILIDTEVTVEGDLAPVGFWFADGDDGDTWFSFLGAGTLVDIETFAGSNNDTQIAVYDACGGNILAADDDGGTGTMSLITGLCAEAGTTYYVEVEGWDGTFGDFTISVVTSGAAPATVCSDVNASNFVTPTSCDIVDNLTCTYGCSDPAAANFVASAADCAGVVGGGDNSCCVYPPSNDTCASAETLATDGTVVAGDNTGGSSTVDAAGSTAGAPEVWYEFTGTGNTVVIETAANVMTDSQMALFDGCAGALIEFNDDGGTGNMSQITICTTLGTVYAVEVQGWNGQVGSFDISVTDGGLVEYCDDVTATNFNGAPGACDVLNNTTCIFTNPGCQDPTALNYDAAFDRDCANLVGVDFSCCTYAPTNDACASATALTIDAAATSDDNTNATNTEDGCLSTGAADLWYSFVGAGGLVDIETFANGMTDSQIGIFANCGDAPTECDDDDGLGNMSLISGFCAETGVTYYVHVQGWNGAVGTFDISVVTSGAAPAEYCGDPAAANYNATPGACDVQNDLATCVYVFDGCADATAIVVDAAAISGDNTSTLDENFGAEPACFGNDGAGAGDIWFSFDGTGGLVDIETFENGGMDDSQIAVYSDCAGTLLDCSEDDGAGFMSLISGFCAEAGTTYYVEVEGYGTAEGSFDISVVTSAAAAATYCGDAAASNYNATPTACDVLDNGTCTYAPANDNLANAEALVITDYGTCTSVPGTNVGSSDSGESDNVNYLDVWYSFTADAPGIRIEVNTSNMDLFVELYDAGGFLLSEDSGATGAEVMYADAVPGTEYFVSISGWDGGIGDFSVCAQRLAGNEVATADQGAVYPCGGIRLLHAENNAPGGIEWSFDDGVDVYTYSSASSTINLSSVPGLPSGSYAVTVNSVYDGFEVSSVLTQPITVNQPITVLKPQFIGATFAFRGNIYMRCQSTIACGYEGFLWRITNVGTGTVHPDVLTTGDLFFLSNIPDLAYNSEYTAEIAVVYDGGAVSAYSSPETFFIDGVATLQLREQFNSSNTTLALTQDLRASIVIANQSSSYEWLVERTDVTELPFTTLSNIGVIRVNTLPLAEGGTYNIWVRSIVDGVTPPATVGIPNSANPEWGPVQEVVVIGGAGMVQTEDDTTPVVLEATNVKDNVISAAVTMYPNPTSDFVTLSITGMEDGTDKVLVDIYNSVGQLVQSEQLSADGNYVNSVVTLNDLAEGMYNVQITVGNTVSTERMIIQK